MFFATVHSRLVHPLDLTLTYTRPVVYTAAFSLPRLPRHAPRDGQRRAPPPARVPGFSHREDQRGAAGPERAPAGEQLGEHYQTAHFGALPPRKHSAVGVGPAPGSLFPIDSRIPGPLEQTPAGSVVPTNTRFRLPRVLFVGVKLRCSWLFWFSTGGVLSCTGAAGVCHGVNCGVGSFPARRYCSSCGLRMGCSAQACSVGHHACFSVSTVRLLVVLLVWRFCCRVGVNFVARFVASSWLPSSQHYCCCCFSLLFVLLLRSSLVGCTAVGLVWDFGACRRLSLTRSRPKSRL